MAYSEKVLDHYENPRNVGSFDKNDPSVGSGMVGAPACGDVMKLHIKVGKDGVIEEARFKTYGCGSAIASSSLVTEWLRGKDASSRRSRSRTPTSRRNWRCRPSRSIVPCWPRTPSRRPSTTIAPSRTRRCCARSRGDCHVGVRHRPNS